MTIKIELTINQLYWLKKLLTRKQATWYMPKSVIVPLTKKLTDADFFT